MRRSLVAGNWKMNGSRELAHHLADGIRSARDVAERVDIAVCPSYVYLTNVAALLAESPIKWGAQDVSQHEEGAYTGEVSASMLADLGCAYAIVGHSERRTYHAESDELVAAKAQVAHRHGLTPIICVGELLEERESGATEAVVGRQLDALLAVENATELLSAAVIAYEPVWAIGTGRTATPQQAQEVHSFIRERISTCDSAVGENIRILYGGSVKAANAQELFAMDDIDGGLVGGASLDLTEFLAICKAVPEFSVGI